MYPGDLQQVRLDNEPVEIASQGNILLVEPRYDVEPGREERTDRDQTVQRVVGSEACSVDADGESR